MPVPRRPRHIEATGQLRRTRAVISPRWAILPTTTARRANADMARYHLVTMTRDRDDKRWSKRLSYVLRHDPGSARVELDVAGWVEIDALLLGLGGGLSRERLEAIVAASPKQRFALSSDGARIRANQGHSVEVDLGYEPRDPPQLLYHGTHPGAVAEIRRSGIQRMSRHHVHLSADAPTARAVGSRRGEPVILVIDAALMHGDGHLFYRSANGVWLTDAVPPRYIRA